MRINEVNRTNRMTCGEAITILDLQEKIAAEKAKIDSRRPANVWGVLAVVTAVSALGLAAGLFAIPLLLHIAWHLILWGWEMGGGL